MELFEVIMKFEDGLNKILINDQTVEDYLGYDDFATLNEIMCSYVWDDVIDVTYADYSGNHSSVEVKTRIMNAFDDFDKLEQEVGLIGVMGGKLTISL